MRPRLFIFGVAGCTVAVLTFLVVQLTAWPPHEDETLALFVGREPVGSFFHTVLGERGGAPLHFMLSWVVTHAGGGLTELRLVSALFAAASVPIIAALGAKLADRASGLAATAIASASWVLLFHGDFARMYSLFLFTSAASYLTLLLALEKGGRRAWGLWVLAMLLAVASHPYGAIVLGSQVLFVLLTRRRVREAALAFAALLVLAIPMWRSDIVLAGRFDVGASGGKAQFKSLDQIWWYIQQVASDFTAGYHGWFTAFLILALVGLVRLLVTRPRSALLIAIVIGAPIAALLLARLGPSISPQSRHLIFALPFFSLLVGAGLVQAARLVPHRLAGPAVALAALAALVPTEIAWGLDKTPELYRGESSIKATARHEAASWLASTARPDDVLFGYEPVYLEAWEQARGKTSSLVIPRADSKLALGRLESAKQPLGDGVWVFDASDTTNVRRRLTIGVRVPAPSAAYEARAFGPYLVIRTLQPTLTPTRFLQISREVETVGKSLSIGDADRNLKTVLEAGSHLIDYEAARSRSRSTVSR